MLHQNDNLVSALLPFIEEKKERGKIILYCFGIGYLCVCREFCYKLLANLEKTCYYNEVVRRRDVPLARRVF